MKDKITLYTTNNQNQSNNTENFQKKLLNIINSQDYKNIIDKGDFSMQEQVLIEGLQGIENTNIKISLGHWIQHLKSGAQLKDLLVFDNTKLVIPYDADHASLAQEHIKHYNIYYKDTPQDEQHIKQALEYARDGKIVLFFSNHATIANKPFEINYLDNINSKYNIIPDIGMYHNTVMGPLIATRNSMKNTINGQSNLYITQPETDLPKEKDLIKLNEEERSRIQKLFSRNILKEFHKPYGQLWHIAPGGSKDIITVDEQGYQIIFGNDETTSAMRTIGFFSKCIEKYPERFVVILLGMDEYPVDHPERDYQKPYPISTGVKSYTGKEFLEIVSMKAVTPTIASLIKNPITGQQIGHAVEKETLINLYKSKK